MANLNNGKAAESAKEEVIVNANEAVNESGKEATNASGIKNSKQVIAELLAKGCRRITGLRVRSAIVTPKDNYVMISMTLEQGITGYVADKETGVFAKSTVNTVFASSYSIGSILKDNDDTAWAANQLVQNPKGFEVILAGSKVDIIQEEVSADEIYVNPFSNSANEGSALGHDTIINHVTKIELCKKAQKMLDMLAMNMMGI